MEPNSSDNHTLPVEEVRRLEALESVGIMDTPPDDRFDRLARIAKHCFDVPIVLITFISEERQWFKSHLGISESEGPRAASFCTHTIEEDRILYIPDATKDPQFLDNPMVSGEFHLRFYAGAPIRTPDGYRIGTLCLVDTKPKTLSAEDFNTFREIADCVEHELAQSDMAAINAAHQASRMGAILDTAADAIFTFDDMGNIRTVNSAAVTIFGYTTDEFSRTNIDALFSASYLFHAGPETQKGAGNTWVEADGLPQNVEGKRKDGSTFSMQISVDEMAHFNQRQFVAIARDVTEQRTKEWLLDAIVENIPNMVFVKDATDLRFTLFNRAGESLFGVPRNALIGKNDFDLVPPEQAEFFVQMDREALQKTEPVDIWEEPLDSKTKGRRILHTRKVAIRDENGAAKYLLGISEDITERKKIERNLAKSLETAEQASRGKSDFLAHMSHELRSPLNSIIGFSQIMRDAQFGDLDERYREYSGDIYNSASHLLELINDILDISRIEAGEFTLDETDIDIRLPVEEAIRTISIRAQAKNQNLVNDIKRDHAHLHADSRYLRQILINLLSNAVRFTPEGGEIRVSSQYEESGGLSLQVSDNGIGIAEKDLANILEPFAQVRQDAHLSQEGTGLGLTLSKRMAELHGGALKIDSTLGVGTTVTVTFPADRLL